MYILIISPFPLHIILDTPSCSLPNSMSFKTVIHWVQWILPINPWVWVIFWHGQPNSGLPPQSDSPPADIYLFTHTPGSSQTLHLAEDDLELPITLPMPLGCWGCSVYHYVYLWDLQYKHPAAAGPLLERTESQSGNCDGGRTRSHAFLPRSNIHTMSLLVHTSTQVVSQ